VKLPNNIKIKENNKNTLNQIKKNNDIILPEISKTTDNVTLVSPSTSTTSNSNIQSKKWPMVWNESQWIECKEKYPWIVSADGKLGCNICSSITCLGASKKERLRISNEWSNGLIEASGKDRTSQLSNLRTKIKKHYESEGHQLADKINKEGKEKSIEVSMQKSI